MWAEVVGGYGAVGGGAAAVSPLLLVWYWTSPCP